MNDNDAVLTIQLLKKVSKNFQTFPDTYIFSGSMSKQYKQINKLGTISQIGFGTWQLGGGISIGEKALGYGKFDEEEAKKAIHYAIEKGITFFGNNYSKIQNTSIEDKDIGIAMGGSFHNLLKNLTISNNLYSGVYSVDGSNNTIINSVISENSGTDLYVIEPGDKIENITGSGGREIRYYSRPVNLANLELSELILYNASYSNITNITIKGSDTLENNGIYIREKDGRGYPRYLL